MAKNGQIDAARDKSMSCNLGIGHMSVMEYSSLQRGPLPAGGGIAAFSPARNFSFSRAQTYGPWDQRKVCSQYVCPQSFGSKKAVRQAARINDLHDRIYLFADDIKWVYDCINSIKCAGM